MLTLPNLLTLSRIVALPVLVALMWWPDWELGYALAFALYSLMGITDYFDGYLARAQGAVSKLGIFLDPIADKIMVAAVILVLAAQYESWLLPLAVILVVPLGIFGVVAAVNFTGTDNNMYTQIGVVLIIALASKNAILIVEFARELRLQGRSIHEAAIEAARMRFRPILMTSFAFIMGVLPLVWATGAAAASRRALGTAVFGGMITSTVLAVFFVPVFYVAVQKLIEVWNGPPKFISSEELHPSV